MTEVGTREPRVAAAELAGLLLGVEYLLWGELVSGFAWLQLPIVVLLIALCWRSYTRRRAERVPAAPKQGWGSSIGQTVVATAVAAGVVLLATRGLGWWSGGAPHFDIAALANWGDLEWWAGKGGAVLLQQLLLQLVIAPLLFEISGRRLVSLALAGVVFGGVHLPNPALSLLTVVAAPVWCGLYARGGRLLPLVISHLLLAILVRGACGDAIYNMRVGASVLPLLPRIVVAEDGSTLRVSPRSLEGYVEGCKAEEQHVTCSGWAADVDRRRAVEAIVVLAAGNLRRISLSGDPRADVADSFGLPELLHVGFAVELPLEFFAAADAPRFFGVSENQAAELEYLTDRRLSDQRDRER